MANGNIFGGLMRGFAGTGAPKLIGQRLFESDEERLIRESKAEGSLTAVKNDIRDFLMFSPEAAQYMIKNIKYADRPAGAGLMLALIQKVTPPDRATVLAGMSTKEKDQYWDKVASILIENLDKAVAMGAEAPTGAARERMIRPLEKRYGTEAEGYPTKVPMPAGSELWSPEVTKGYFRGYQAPGGKPATAGMAAKAKAGLERMPAASPEYVKFMENRNTYWEGIGDNTDQVLVALLGSGSEAAKRAASSLGMEDPFTKLKTKYPALTASAALKEILGMDKMEDFDSSAIEGKEPIDKIRALAWIAKEIHPSPKALMWLLNNWWYGRPTAEVQAAAERMPWEEPGWWSMEKAGGGPGIGGAFKGLLGKWGM